MTPALLERQNLWRHLVLHIEVVVGGVRARHRAVIYPPHPAYLPRVAEIALVLPEPEPEPEPEAPAIAEEEVVAAADVEVVADETAPAEEAAAASEEITLVA